MSGLFFGFTDCMPELQGPLLVIPAAVPEVQTAFSVLPDRSDYTFIEQAVRHFRGWITVTAEWFRRTVVRGICTRFRNVFRMTGVQILHRYAILRI